MRREARDRAVQRILAKITDPLARQVMENEFPRYGTKREYPGLKFPRPKRSPRVPCAKKPCARISRDDLLYRQIEKVERLRREFKKSLYERTAK